MSMQRFLNWLGALSAVVATLASVAGVALWRSQGLTMLSVQSDSMQPHIHKGDAVLARKPVPASIRAGDIVSYPSQQAAGEIITHRVVYSDQPSGRLITKGDANITADPPTNVVDVIGQVQSVVPQAGFAIDTLRSWSGLVALVYIPAAAVLVQEVVRVVRYYGRPTYRLVRT